MVRLTAMPLTTLLLLLATVPQPAVGDLPVHCLRHQVAGDWIFTVSPAKAKRSSCGHRRPDNSMLQPSKQLLDALGPATTQHLKLAQPNTVIGESGANGTWTMVYDEGFEVKVGDLTFLGFSKFELLDEDPQGRTNISYCGRTQVGWYQDASRQRFGCWYGRKAGAAADFFEAPPASPAKKKKRRRGADAPLNFLAPAAGQFADEDADAEASTTRPPTLSLVDVSQAPAEYAIWKPTKLASGGGYDRPMDDGWQRMVAQALNFLQLGWHAEPYATFEGRTPRDMNRHAGVRRSRPQRRPQRRPPAADAFLGLGSRVRRVRDVEAMDWRSHDGHDWISPVVTQGDCGSCYTISTVHMLTARNRIGKKNVTAPEFSVTFPLYCSEYNQGCDGGYGFLQSRWSEDVGLVPESCLPFDSGSSGAGACKVTKGCDLGAKRYRASGHHYVGGFYGASDAELIKRELVANGPVVMSFEPKEDFMYYRSGVYTSVPNKIHQEWEQVDHAVLLVGFGFDVNRTAKQPYWTVQNSWGEEWGENGYFRMARGTDESGCESIVVAASVVEESENRVLDDFIHKL